MPNPEEVCSVSIGGSTYRDWTHVSVTREFGATMSRATLKIVEKNKRVLDAWASIKVGLGLQGTVALGGRTVINGFVDTRQAAISATQAAVQIEFVSFTAAAVEGSAAVKPGEFRKYSFEQIAGSLLGEAGVGLKVLNSAKEISKRFDVFRVIPGETIFDALDRLARFRNVFFTDDAEGNLVVGRGVDGTAPSLVEGGNIKSASLRMSNPFLAEKVRAQGQRSGTDTTWGDPARSVSAIASVTGSVVKGTQIIAAEMQGDPDDMRMRAEHEIAANLATSVECVVVVQGWFAASGRLWIEHIGEDITVQSDTLFPGGSMKLKLRAVTHTQDPGQSGTETQLLCCHPSGLGAGAKPNAGPIDPPFGFEPGKPEAPEQ